MTARAGFFGKVPALGDFVSGGLARPAEDAIEAWARSGMARLKEARPEDWLQAYLVAPVWRFAARIAGDARVGVWCPSVDAVGRYFPMVVAAAPSSGAAPGWFDRAEELARAALRPEGFDLERWRAAVSALGPGPDDLEAGAWVRADGDGGRPAMTLAADIAEVDFIQLVGADDAGVDRRAV